MKIRIVNWNGCVVAAGIGTLLGMTSATARAASLTYSDGNFSTNWSVTQVGPTGSVSGVQVASGGNPGAYWQVTDNVATTDIGAISLRSDFTFNPSASGPIFDLSFSYDAITQIAGQGQGTAPALLQNGVVYEVLPENSGYYGSYTAISFANLGAGSFIALNGSNTHPDFSATGSIIVFGFANSNSGTGVYSNRTTQSDYDNFSITVDFTPIPEPNTCAFLGAGALAALTAAFKRKRSRLGCGMVQPVSGEGCARA